MLEIQEGPYKDFIGKVKSAEPRKKVKLLMDRLGVPATTRASFYIYNQPDEVDQLVSGIQKAQKVFA